jgi:hypothetical protein
MVNKIALAAAVSLAALSMPAAASTTINFSFDATGFLAETSGFGSFTSSVSDGVISKSNLTAFSINGSGNAIFFLGADYSFGLNDLNSFSATLDHGTLTDLQFKTDKKSFPYSIFGFPAGSTKIQLQAKGLDAGEFSGSAGFIKVKGTLTPCISAAVPEPASWAMMIGGVGFVGGAMRRRQGVTAKVRFA